MASLKVVSIDVARQRRREAREPLKTKAEIAEHFGVSTRTVSRWRTEHAMPCVQRFEGGSVRFSVHDCDAWFRGTR